MQTFESDFFIHFMLIVILGTIDINHIVLFSVALTMAMGHSVSGQQNLMTNCLLFN